MSEDETQKDRKSIFSTKILVIIAIILAVTATTISAVAAFKKSEQLFQANAKLSDLKSSIKSTTILLEKRTEDLNKIKKKIFGIKDKDDLLKRDIELYIKTTHPKVPNVVAKTIAINTVIISKKHKLAPELIVGIMKAESSFNPMIVGPKTKYGHARGLMQVMPEWVKKLGLKSAYDLHNINVGIDAGSRVFLIHLKEEKGDIATALYKYVNRDKAYVGKVYAAMGKFVAFRSTIDEEEMNVDTDIENNGIRTKERRDKLNEKKTNTKVKRSNPTG